MKLLLHIDSMQQSLQCYSCDFGSTANCQTNGWPLDCGTNVSMMTFGFITLTRTVHAIQNVDKQQGHGIADGGNGSANNYDHDAGTKMPMMAVMC